MLFITSAHVVSAHNSISAVINNSPFESWKLVTALFMGNFLKLLHFRNKSSPRRLMGSPVMYTFGFWTFLWVLSEQHNFFLWFWEISKIWMYLQLLLLKKMTKSLHVNCPKRQLDDYIGFKNEKKKSDILLQDVLVHSVCQHTFLLCAFDVVIIFLSHVSHILV